MFYVMIGLCNLNPFDSDSYVYIIIIIIIINMFFQDNIIDRIIWQLSNILCTFLTTSTKSQVWFPLVRRPVPLVSLNIEDFNFAWVIDVILYLRVILLMYRRYRHQPSVYIIYLIQPKCHRNRAVMWLWASHIEMPYHVFMDCAEF